MTLQSWHPAPRSFPTSWKQFKINNHLPKRFKNPLFTLSKNLPMKKLNLLLLVILGTTFFSCSSSDSDENGNISKIIGTWYGISSTFNGNNSGVPDNSIVIFTSNNRVEFIYEGFGNNGEDISEYGNWSIIGNTLTITWDDSDPTLENYVLEIVELNQSTLKWQTEIAGGGTLIETFSTNQNATVDLSQFQDYVFEYVVALSNENQDESYEFKLTIITTNGDNGIEEISEIVSGSFDDASVLFHHHFAVVKEYKVVGIKVEQTTTNIINLSASLKKESDLNEVLTVDTAIPNSGTITYDFETGIETITTQ